MSELERLSERRKGLEEKIGKGSVAVRKARQKLERLGGRWTGLIEV